MSPNQAIGHYRVTGKLGEGGMGEVWRATDTKLNRDVAIKILPAAFAADPDRMARFTREAQVLASLNHPNIAQIYGVEDRALVMELVDGPTLSERIGQSALPADEALDIARQIGDALEAAHEKGIVHRDLKPANIKLTTDGRVKVLDFGLAKALSGGDSSIADPANSPTMTMSATAAGVIMGTAGYMAPEQAKGKPVDKRADIWAFGVVFYEMLTAHRLFDGETAAESMAAVLTREPDIEKVPLKFRKLLRSCLEKEPKRRLRDIADAWQLVAEETTPAAALPQPRNVRWIGIAAALAFVAVVAFAGWFRATRPVDHPMMRLNLDLGPDALPQAAGLVLSPDGRRIVFAVRRPDGKTQLGVRPLDQAQPTLLPGTEDGVQPFFSHDGQWIAFFAGFNLKKIPVQGGAPVTVAALTGTPTGGDWDDGGNIITALSHSANLSVVSSAGAVRTLTRLTPGVETHRWPQVLPGGKSVLFTASQSISGMEGANVVAADMKTGEIKILVRSAYFGRYLPGGFLTYLHEGVLFATHFDVSRLQVQGTPVPMVESVFSDSVFGDGWSSFSEVPGGAGTLVYLSGKDAGKEWRFTLIDAQQSQPLITQPGAYYNPAFSPDGRRIAFVIADQGIDIYVYDIARAAMTRLTSGGDADRPVWSPDGTHIAYVKQDGIWWVRSDGASDPERLAEAKHMVPWSFSPDGRKLAFFQINAETTYDIGILPMDTRKQQFFLQTPAAEACPVFSPDGRWIAYSSNASGTNEVYVRPAEGDGKWQISNGGGMWAMWAPKGGPLYYEDLDGHIHVVDYSVNGTSFEAGKPRLWSDRQLQRVFKSNIALAPDGKHFAVFEPVEGGKTAPKVAVLLNFLDELKRRLP
jgi:Tol biopolymer transport system component/predicted Ser/Thr protein kinase